MLSHRDSDLYQAVWRYYFACIGSFDSHRLIAPLTLLKQALGQLDEVGRVRRDVDADVPRTAGLSQIRQRIETFETRLQNNIAYNQNSGYARPEEHALCLAGRRYWRDPA